MTTNPVPTRLRLNRRTDEANNPKTMYTSHRTISGARALDATPVGFYVTLLTLGTSWEAEALAPMLPLPIWMLHETAQATMAHHHGDTAIAYVLSDMNNMIGRVARVIGA